MAVDHDHLHALSIRHELQTSTRRLYVARSRVPPNMKPYQVGPLSEILRVVYMIIIHLRSTRWPRSRSS